MKTGKDVGWLAPANEPSPSGLMTSVDFLRAYSQLVGLWKVHRVCVSIPHSPPPVATGAQRNCVSDSENCCYGWPFSSFSMGIAF